MNVKDLIEILKNQNPNALIVLSKDVEGDGFSPLSDVEDCQYKAMTSWHGDICDTAESVDGVSAVVFWPTN